MWVEDSPTRAEESLFRVITKLGTEFAAQRFGKSEKRG
jgi:hypothetical protein